MKKQLEEVNDDDEEAKADLEGQLESLQDDFFYLHVSSSFGINPLRCQ